MKILVTGATGFLGNFLCKRLSEDNHEIVRVSSKNCDLTKENSLEQFDDIAFDQIYHLAAWTQAGDFCLYHPAEQWIINQKINTNVLSWWQKKQPHAKIICMGTSCSYDPNLELIEDNYLKGEPIESLYTYAMTKRMLLNGLRAINKQFGLEYLYLIPSTLYGPNYHNDGRQMHFIFDLVRKIIRGKLYDEHVVLWGDGSQVRELVYVEDFINIMMKLVRTEKNRIFNIGSERGYSIKEFAEKICEIINYPIQKVLFDTTKYVGAKSKILSVERLQKVLPGVEMKDLSEGLKDVVKWFKDNIFSEELKV